MKKSRFTEAQIMGVLRQMEGGVPAAELCREHGMSSATLYKWRAKCQSASKRPPRSAPKSDPFGARVSRPVAALLFSWRSRRGPAFWRVFRLGF